MAALGRRALARPTRRATCRARSTRCRGWRSRCRRTARRSSPSRTSRATSGPAPVWTTAGPHTARIRPPAARARPDALGHLGHQQALGLLRRHLRGHELERARRPAGRSRGCTRTPSLPTTTRSPGRTRCIGHGAAPRSSAHDQRAVHLRVLDVEPVAVDPHLGGQVGGGVEAGRQHAVAIGTAPARRRPASTRLAPCTCSSLEQAASASSSSARDLDAGPGSGRRWSCRSRRRRSGSRRRRRGSRRASWPGSASR